MPGAPASTRSSKSSSTGYRRSTQHRARNTLFTMRYLVLTDIHANLEALDTCLADARTRGFDATLCLGDLVGYGADPNAVIERIQSLTPITVVRGNHDKV